MSAHLGEFSPTERAKRVVEEMLTAPTPGTGEAGDDEELGWAGRRHRRERWATARPLADVIAEAPLGAKDRQQLGLQLSISRHPWTILRVVKEVSPDRGRGGSARSRPDAARRIRSRG
jgi:hypothetical protein